MELMPKLGFWSLLKTEIQKPSLMQQGLISMPESICYCLPSNANTFVQKENAGEMGRSVSYRDMPSV